MRTQSQFMDPIWRNAAIEFLRAASSEQLLDAKMGWMAVVDFVPITKYLAAGYFIDVTDKTIGTGTTGKTALILASEAGLLPIVTYLLSQKAKKSTKTGFDLSINPNITDSSGETALGYALKNKHYEVARAICESEKLKLTQQQAQGYYAGIKGEALQNEFAGRFSAIIERTRAPETKPGSGTPSIFSGFLWGKRHAPSRINPEQSGNATKANEGQGHRF